MNVSRVTDFWRRIARMVANELRTASKYMIYH
jgi:hypothetical protein